jgi:catechol 2,3-dioxygenase-like lactoylglutathione lyase family enzyme
MTGPAPRLRQVVLDTTDARAAAEFWRQLVGLRYRRGHEPPPPGADDPAGRDWLNLQTKDGEPALAFQQVETLPPSTWPDEGVPQQLHLDLSVATAEELTQVRERVLALGGRILLDRFDDPEEPLYAFADLDGHPFCVFVADD